MPAKSVAQQEFFGAALSRKRAGKARSSDPKMSEVGLKEFASTKRKGLPYRAKSSQKKRRQKIAEIRQRTR